VRKKKPNRVAENTPQIPAIMSPYKERFPCPPGGIATDACASEPAKEEKSLDDMSRTELKDHLVKAHSELNAERTRRYQSENQAGEFQRQLIRAEQTIDFITRTVGRHY